MHTVFASATKKQHADGSSQPWHTWPACTTMACMHNNALQWATQAMPTTHRERNQLPHELLQKLQGLPAVQSHGDAEGAQSAARHSDALEPSPSGQRKLAIAYCWRRARLPPWQSGMTEVAAGSQHRAILGTIARPGTMSIYEVTCSGVSGAIWLKIILRGRGLRRKYVGAGKATNMQGKVRIRCRGIIHHRGVPSYTRDELTRAFCKACPGVPGFQTVFIWTRFSGGSLPVLGRFSENRPVFSRF